MDFIIYIYTYDTEMFSISMYQQVGHGTSQSVLRHLFVSFVELGQGQLLLPRCPAINDRCPY